ncbi:MAG: hypothetical protein WC716_02395 [Chitinophagaceae bacterium]|jgi:hypothetical protein
MKDKSNQNNFRKMQRLVNITENFLLSGNIVRAKRCFTIAEELLSRGSAEMKCAVSNVFVYSVSSFMEFHHFKISTFFPQTLQKEYYSQIYCSGT